jgi:hypothetical protein
MQVNIRVIKEWSIKIPKNDDFQKFAIFRENSI